MSKNNSNMEYLAVYSEKCLRCKHLVEGATKKFKNCHHSKGNDQCPAAGVRIVVVGKIQRITGLIKEARNNKDPLQESKVWEAVAKESSAFQNRLYEHLTDNKL